MANKLAVSLKDPTTGVETNAQEITNAPNGDYIVVRGAQATTDPNGNEWTAETLTAVQHKLVAQTSQNTTTTVRSSGHTIEFWSSPIANNVFMAPSDNMEFSNDPDNPITNVIGWDYDDSLDQKDQTGWRIRIFPDFVVKSAGFDPNSNPYFVWAQSGTDDSNQVTITKSDGFISGERYWAYVQVSKEFHNQQWLGDWTAKPFTVIIEQPQPAIISVLTNTDNATNELLIQSTDNLLSDRNGDFGDAETGHASLGGWNVAGTDTSNTTIDVGVTGGVLGADLTPGQSISVIPFGATGYVSTSGGISATQSVGTKFKVSGANGNNASPLGFPLSGQFWILMPANGEKILVTNAVDGTKKTDPDTFTIVQRGYQNTTPAAHAQWDTIIYGTQDDIFVGTVGTLRWEKTMGGVTTRKVVAGRHGYGGHPLTVNDTSSYKVVSIPKGQDNSKKKYLWVQDPHDSLKAGMVGTLAHATSKATNPTKKAKSVATENNITIDFVSNAPTTKPSTILFAHVNTTVTGDGGTSISSLPITLTQKPTSGIAINNNNDSSLLACLVTAPLLGPGYVVQLAWYDSQEKKWLNYDLTLDKAVKVAVGTSAHLTFRPHNSFGAFNGSAPGANGAAVFQIPAGTKVYYTPPNLLTNTVKRLTLSQPLASYPAVGDKFDVTVTTTYQHVGAVAGTPTKVTKTTTPTKTVHYEQDFLVSESVSTTLGNNSTVSLGASIGYWDGSVFSPATSPYNAVQVVNTPNNNEDVYVGFDIIGLGIPVNTVVETVVPDAANNSVVLVLSANAVPAYGTATGGTLQGPIYTIDVTLEVPSSTVIPAGSQSIPVVPFVPKAKYPIGMPIKFSYPPYFGTNSMLVETTVEGSTEITIQDPNWSGWNSSNGVQIVPGTVYGFSAFARSLGTGTPTFNLYIDWFDQLNNLLATSDGSQSLANPSVNNTLPPVVLGQTAAGWTPNAIVAVAPKSATIVPVAHYYSTITGGGNLTATATVGTQTVNLNSVSGVTIVAGDILTLGTGLNAEEVQVQQIVSTVITTTQKLLYNHSGDLVSTGSAYHLASPLTVDISANTTLVMGSGAVVVTNAAASVGATTIPVQFTSGQPIAGADSLGMSAAYACPRMEFVNNAAENAFAVAAPCYKALTAHDPLSEYVAINTEIPALLRGVDSIGGASSFLVPEGTPTEGAGTIYVFDPVDDGGTREIHMGSGDPILDTTLAAKVQAGSTSINVKSSKGLAAGRPIVLNVFGSLPSSADGVVDVTTALYQAGLTATEANAAKAANNQAAANFTKTAGVVNDTTETVIIDAFWDGSNVVTLEQPLKNSYPVGTQVCSFTTGIDGSFLNNQVQGTEVATLNWNRSGYLDTPGTQYYFVVEYSNDYGKTWTTLGGGDNLVPDAHGQASITDYAVIPNSATYYRATANYIDKDKDKTVTKGAVSPPSLAPALNSDSWWISSTSDQTVRFAINVQNGVQETQKHPVGVFYPLGSSRPYTVAGVVQGRDAVIEVIWTDNARWQDFIDFLNTGETMLLLDPVEGERRYIFISDDVKVTHNAAANPWRLVTITYVEAAPPGFGFLYGGK